MREPRPRPPAVLFAALVLIVILAVFGFAQGPPEYDPAEVWMTMVWSLRYELFPLESDSQLADLHRDASDGSREQCIACHGPKTDSELPVHRIHLSSDLLRNLACHDCHQQVDLGSRGATTAVTWVDVGFCRKCHSAFPGGRTEEHACAAKDPDEDCTECHTGDLAVRHDQPYLSRKLPASECLGCHGGRELPWTARHEQDGWLLVHGEEALGMGEDHCFECHDFGLKFCDECHAETPPSHLPADTWKDIHPQAARTDTRVCYTCHETDYCKRCHVNHEEGWMQSHPAFVAERGDSGCQECHSASSCSFCHATNALDGRSSLPTTAP